MRRTKIICTLGPATSTVDKIIELIEAGMAVARVNSAHGTPESRVALVNAVREAEARTGGFIAIMVDLQGPKIRVGKLQGGSVILRSGAHVTITTESIEGTAQRFSTIYDRFADDVKPGETVLLADGLLSLRVEGITGREVTCLVLEGGELAQNKGINLPDSAISTPALTAKDKEDALLAKSWGVDYIALSFVRAASDIRELRALLGDGPRIVAKIERPEALRDLEAIVQASDVVMVARGDLGVELAAHRVPVIQKNIIAVCNDDSTPVITATQMLESMVSHARPTRAEVSDIANAVLDGTDAVMLSEETSVGAHPVDAVRIMAETCLSAEALLRPIRDDEEDLSRLDAQEQAITQSACVLARELHANALVALTHRGTTARLLSSWRPPIPILAMTSSVDTARWCAMYWGVRGIMIPVPDDTDDALAIMRNAALTQGGLAPGDMVIFSAGHPLTLKPRTNFLKAEKL